MPVINELELTMNDDDIPCQYLNIEEAREKFDASASNFLLLHCNIRSFNKNIDELCASIKSMNCCPDVLVLSETWFSPSNNLGNIEGFNGYHTFRQQKRGGGISVFVHKKYKTSSLQNLSLCLENIETSAVKIYLADNSSVTVIGCYRPPDPAQVNNFLENLNNVLSSTNSNQKLYLIGDLNIDLTDGSQNSSDLMDLMHSFNMVPVITKPTRITDNSRSLIDHIWTNNLAESESGIVKVCITDHYPIFVHTVTRTESSTSFVKKFRDHSNHNILNLETRLSNFLQTFYLYDGLPISIKCKILCEKLYDLYNSCCPIRSKTVSLNRTLKPWLTDSLIEEIRLKHIMYNRFKSGLIEFEVYNNQNKRSASLLKNAKKLYYTNKFNNCIGDIKRTWKQINKLIKPQKGNSGIDSIMEDDVKVDDPTRIANCFNEFFATIGSKLDALIPTTNNNPLDYLGPRQEKTFFSAPSTFAEVSHLLMSLPNKSSSLYEVPTSIFKKLKNTISQAISDLFNDSCREGSFPDNLKSARITPIHKNGDRKSVNNYRPISTLPLLSKIFEKLMYSRLYSFLSKNQILAEHQFGFRLNRNTSDAVLQFLDYAYDSLDKGNQVMAIFLDLKKAFDTVNHKILLDKLNHLGIRGISHKWFCSYLENRNQLVSVNKVSSDVSKVFTGVPQGSVIGPLLFLIYINDMSRCSKLLDFIHFADDTTLFATHKDINQLVTIVDTELAKIDTWLRSNRLSLNVSKTTYMILSRNSGTNQAPRIRDMPLTKVSSMKFLGITIDDKLSFHIHCNNVARDVSRGTGILYRLSNSIPDQVAFNLYFSLIYTKMSYGITCWGNANARNINKMKKIQTRAFKALKFNNCHLDPKFIELLQFESIHKFFTAQKFFKTLKLNQHVHFANKLLPLHPHHSYSTRFADAGNMNLPRYSKSKSQNSFLFQSIQIWNELPDSLKDCGNPSQFKSMLKSHLIQQQLLVSA